MKRLMLAIFLFVPCPSPLLAESVENSLVRLGDKAWTGFKCVRFADEASGSVDPSADHLFDQSLIAARAFLSAYEAGLISSEAMVDAFRVENRRFFFGPSVEFKVGAMVTLATLEADGFLASVQGERVSAAAEAWSRFGCGNLR